MLTSLYVAFCVLDMKSHDIRRLSPHNDLFAHSSLPPPPAASSLSRTDTSLLLGGPSNTVPMSTVTPPLSLHRASTQQLKQRQQLRKFPFFDTICRLYDRFKPELLPVLLDVAAWHYNSRLHTPLEERRSARSLAFHDSSTRQDLSSSAGIARQDDLRRFTPFREYSRRIQSSRTADDRESASSKSHGSRTGRSKANAATAGDVFYSLALNALCTLEELFTKHEVRIAVYCSILLPFVNTRSAPCLEPEMLFTILHIAFSLVLRARAC